MTTLLEQDYKEIGKIIRGDLSISLFEGDSHLLKLVVDFSCCSLTLISKDNHSIVYIENKKAKDKSIFLRPLIELATSFLTYPVDTSIFTQKKIMLEIFIRGDEEILKSFRGHLASQMESLFEKISKIDNKVQKDS